MARNPFEEIERMFDRMSRQFDSLEGEFLEDRVAVDVEDSGDSYVVTANLPGFEREDIDVKIAGRSLTVSADRAESAETDEEGRYIRRERRRQSASRSVRLPAAVDDAETEATYNNGVLTVVLPKAEGEDGQDIPIN